MYVWPSPWHFNVAQGQFIIEGRRFGYEHQKKKKKVPPISIKPVIGEESYYTITVTYFFLHLLKDVMKQ